jgi:hypothetical protein
MLNSIIQPERPTVSAIVSKMRSKEYFVDNSFQRRLVWTERQKIRLIETILMNYPMPEIYLWQQPADPATGNQMFSIVDGQQRLTTVTQFISNEFPLKANALNEENRETDYAGKFWKDLSDARKTDVWNYIINVRQIPSQVSEDQVRRVFMRLNETDKSLNPQELRNAEFNGEFITNAARLADLPIWESWKLFAPSQVRRMADVEFCSSLLVFVRSGISDESPRAVNQIYDLYNDKYDERDSDYHDVKTTLERIDQLAKASAPVARLFLAIVHLYTLFVVLHDHSSGIPENLLLERLEFFVEEYGKQDSTSKLITTYREGASSRTKSKSSREKRVNSLSTWIKGDFS